MSVKLSIWGTNGRITVDRQELQVYLRELDSPVENYAAGWNVRYTTELTPPVWFYVRGEEYSAQIDHFVQCITTGATPLSTFRTASDASLVASKLREDAAKPQTAVERQSARERPMPEAAADTRPKSFVRTILDKL